MPVSPFSSRARASGGESYMAMREMFFRVVVIFWILNLFASLETTASRVPEALHKRYKISLNIPSIP